MEWPFSISLFVKRRRMLSDKINTKSTISISLTAEDWQLYTPMIGVDAAAVNLNTALENAVNSGAGIDDTTLVMSKVMEALSSYGANNLKPRWVLAKLLDLIYSHSTVWPLKSEL